PAGGRSDETGRFHNPAATRACGAVYERPGAGDRRRTVCEGDVTMHQVQHVETTTGSTRTFGPGPAVSGLEFERYFSTEGVDPFDEVEWELRSAVIANERGEVVFEQRDVEFPKFWSQQATNIVVSQYFRGQLGTPERERSVRQLIGRVVDTITGWAREQKYFASEDDLLAFRDDLKHLLL